uniref:CNNM transmembrane domain-containing protein n=1 Tax=Kalanchoe fedtschenkoi TaxID=63787 RepID=A0A7N0U6U8_KALFE
MVSRVLAAGGVGVVEGGISFGSFLWFTYAGISCFLLEILQRSGTPAEKKQAAAILPVVQKQHQLLVTLLLCNACAMEALPIYLDKLFNQFLAIVLSVTFVVAFGEVIPQALCTRYRLAVGANFVWLVRILMIICYPIACPIGKALGHNDTLFWQAQLKALVSIHSQEAGKGGELTHDETTIISGALDLTEKTAEEAMTPIESTFSLDVNSKLDWEVMGKILARGHSRVPLCLLSFFSYNSASFRFGSVSVKSLLIVRAETDTPVSDMSIRRIPRVPAGMRLYDILNEFQKGSSHMAAVDRSDTIIDVDRVPKLNGPHHYSEDIEDGEVIGIITLEDVFKELLQEQIVDETEEFVDMHKRIRVAAAAAASSMARAPPSIRRLTAHKGGHGKPVQTPRKLLDDDSNSPRLQGNASEQLSANKR